MPDAQQQFRPTGEPASAMTVEQRWQRLQDWPGHDPAMQRRFRQQLQANTQWSATDVDAAIEEYRRFCAIAAERGGDVAPSPAVDEVWHLHLTWTRDYWQDFCPNRLGISLHHQPACGRPGESAQLRDHYAETLHAYASRFGTPPERWWPALHAAARPHARRGWTRRLAFAAATLLPAHASANPLAGTTLDWDGSAFLALYLVMSIVALAGSLIWRSLLLRQLPAGASPGVPETWELAYLAGGPERVVDSAVAELDRLDAINWNAATQRFVRGAGAQPRDALLEAVMAQLVERKPEIATAARSTALGRIRSALQRRGWWCSGEQSRRIAMLSAMPLAAVTVFGIAKIGVGVLRDRPVAILVVLCVATTVAALAFLLTRPGITAAGRTALRLAQSRHALTVRAHRGEQVALAVALGGTAVLAGTALAGYHQFRQPPASSGDGGGSSSSSDSSSDGGSSGCGGCGGGD